MSVHALKDFYQPCERLENGMNNEYVIISGATLDLPGEVVKEYGIEVIPMNVHMGGKDYVFHPDERDLTVDGFYERLRAGEESMTSQITPETFREVFTEFLKQGKDILYLGFSSGLSSTYQCSCMAAEELGEKYPDRRIVCIDSLCASVGEGLFILLAARMKKEGKSMDEVAAWARENRTNICHFFSVDDLYHLKRGGRLSGIGALVGTALKIKPILSVDREGKLLVVEKMRGTKKAMEYLKERLRADGIDTKEQTVIVGNADALETALQLKTQLLEAGLVKEVIISSIGPVIGTHVGAGMLALVFLGENYKF